MNERVGVSPPSLFDELGGEPVLHGVVKLFVDRMFADPMIGFFFAGKSAARIREKEYELAAEHLGGPVRYSGRPLAEAHAPHRIMGGQFERRVALLAATLADCDVPLRVRERWLAHTRSLRHLITGDASGECDGTPQDDTR